MVYCNNSQHIDYDRQGSKALFFLDIFHNKNICFECCLRTLGGENLSMAIVAFIFNPLYFPKKKINYYGKNRNWG